ncbi:MAG: DUF1697 domain-containing protein [Sandaracinaceae bacterium]|nr:DUF1697 domain-containing protein [Sandaracinaceae bacterium]
MGASSEHVVLLRAVNVGGTAKLPMAELRRLLEGVGCADVRTYVQSGNAVVRAPARVAASLPARLGDAIEGALGFRPAVIVRSAEAWREVAAAHPFDGEGVEPKLLNVAFLAEAPAAGRALDPARSPGDRALVRGREVYLYYPHGSGRSKLDNGYLERALGTASTMRNWRTVGALAALLSA